MSDAAQETALENEQTNEAALVLHLVVVASSSSVQKFIPGHTDAGESLLKKDEGRKR